MTTSPLLLRKLRPLYTDVWKTCHLNKIQEKD